MSAILGLDVVSYCLSIGLTNTDEELLVPRQPS
jgi:hypothetical protein